MQFAYTKIFLVVTVNTQIMSQTVERHIQQIAKNLPGVCTDAWGLYAVNTFCDSLAAGRLSLCIKTVHDAQQTNTNAGRWATQAAGADSLCKEPFCIVTYDRGQIGEGGRGVPSQLPVQTL